MIKDVMRGAIRAAGKAQAAADSGPVRKVRDAACGRNHARAVMFRNQGPAHDRLGLPQGRHPHGENR